MNVARVEPLLVLVGSAHGLVAVVCAGLLQMDASPLLGLHPAVKPLKFAVSIAMFLVTMAALVPMLSLGDVTRKILASVLSATMIAEMGCIGAQALRGRRSHFNFATPIDSALTRIMVLGIGVLIVAMAIVTWVATAREVTAPALVVAAFRAALWIFLFAAVSGLSMGGRGRHTIGADDGGPGRPFTNWSTTSGDLRVSHFFALHALQVLPLLALLLARLPLAPEARWTLLVIGVAANAWLVVSTFVQALAARSFL